MTWALSTRWAPMRDEAPDLDAVRALAPPAIALARGLPERLTAQVRQLARELSMVWVESPWPDADVDRLDTADRHLRGDAVRAALKTLEAANSLEVHRVVAEVSSAGDDLRFALDPLLSAAERNGVVIGLRGSVQAPAIKALLGEFSGAPLGWVVDLEQPLDLVEAVGDRAVAYVLPNDDERDLAGWRDRLTQDLPRVLDPGPGDPPEALHERAEALLAALAPE